MDLFNNIQNIVITNTERGVWQQIGKVNLNAHSPNPGAPEHLAMVNNLLGDNAKNNTMRPAAPPNAVKKKPNLCMGSRF